MGSFRRTLDSVSALVRTCVDCERYPREEIGSGDVVADCSKTYTSILGASAVGGSGACRVYDLDVQIALVYECAAASGALCVIDDAEALACCLDAAGQVSADQVGQVTPVVVSVRHDRPRGGAYVARLTLRVRGVVCCGD